MEQTSEPSNFRWKWLLAVPLVLLAGWLGYRLVFPAYVRPSLPEPNGYEELVRLGGKLARRTGFYAEMSDEELATVVAANEAVLAEARQAVRKECVVAIDWSADEDWFNEVHMKRGPQLRELARAFAAEGRLAQKQGDTLRAVSCGLDVLQLVPAASHGGLGIDYLASLGISYGGLQWLRDARETATLDDCKFVLNNLPDVREQMEPPAEITVREWHFFRRIKGIYTTFVTEMYFSNNRADFEKRMEESLQNADAMTGLLRLHYAIRAFQLVEGRLPKSLAELAERKWKTSTQDPFSQQDFIYQKGKDRYLLYSVGPNGLDDGGVEEEQDREQGDLLLESRESLGTGTVPAN
jgi:hypothetical protein